MTYRPRLTPPTVVTESEFNALDDILTRWITNRVVLDNLTEVDADIREELKPIALQHITPASRAPFAGVMVQGRKSYTYDPEKALKWATDDQNISGAASMLKVDDAGMMRLIAVIMTTDPETADKLKECLTIDHSGYVFALDAGTHVGMPEFTVDEVPVLSITKQNVKTGQALRDTLLVVADPKPEAAEAQSA